MSRRAKSAQSDVGGTSIAGTAVLLYTGGDAGFGTPSYAHEAPYLTADGAAWLAERQAARDETGGEPDPRWAGASACLQEAALA